MSADTERIASAFKIAAKETMDNCWNNPTFVPSVVAALVVLYVVLLGARQMPQQTYTLQLLGCFVLGVTFLAVIPPLLRQLANNLQI